MFVQYKDHIYNISAISSINVREQILQLAVSFTNGEKTNIRFDSKEDFDEFLENLSDNKPSSEGFLMGVIMACKGCEERHEWIKQQFELFKERLQLRKQRNTSTAITDSGAEHSTDSASGEQGSGDIGSTGAEQ